MLPARSATTLPPALTAEAQQARRYADDLLAHVLNARRVLHQELMDAAWSRILEGLPPPAVPGSVLAGAAGNCGSSDDDDDDDKKNSGDGGGGPPAGGSRTRSPTPANEGEEGEGREDGSASFATPRTAHLDAICEGSFRRGSANGQEMRTFFHSAYDGGTAGGGGGYLEEDTVLSKEELILKFKKLYSAA